ncbi:BcMID1, Ca2+ channel protein [Sclerotinia borealis F-4128]|uniref:BcMID1, Ca2+ channel protein n=1 Tax=Sclerotinia borealis (strain F-4128) TaxID=1432307 RepID=W9CB41_SCLBF|nr:BcMID1, Ca2+ channel protein [Sclerotinia borealis F-4128]
MPLPKLSPLQSRLAASLMGSIMLLVLYLTFSSSHFAYAADVDSIRPEDHNHERLMDMNMLELDSEDEDIKLRAEGYEAEFVGFDRSLIGRVASENDPTPLLNNRAVTTNIEQGQTMAFSFLNSSLWGELSPQASGLPSPVRLRKRNTEFVGHMGEEDLEISDAEFLVVEDGEQNLFEDRETNSTIRPRQSSSVSTRTLYITVNTCTQPEAKGANLEAPSQLGLYISQSEKNKNPGPGQDDSLQQTYKLDGGAAIITLNATGDVYMGLSGSNLTGDYTGAWNAQIAASIDAPYHYYNSDESNLVLVDSDSGSALLVTNDLTTDNGSVYDEWVNLTPPFTMFASKTANSSMTGLQYSYCGLEKKAEIAGTIDGGKSTGKIQVSMTTRGEGDYPKQQLYLDGLTAGTSYYGILAMNGNATALGREGVGGGGQVWKSVTFSTTSADNCALVYNLTFCDQVAYAVPSNPNTFPNTSALAEWYDNSTYQSYKYFKKALAQIPCNTTSSAQYSLAQNCTTCDAAYKAWLCSVTIPRCTEFSSDLPWLQERGMGQPFPNQTMLSPELVSLANSSLPINGSRNLNIDTVVQPGPYKEILPCEDLCYGIVRACPAIMGFACPTSGDTGFDSSYGMRRTANESGQVTCNYPGAAHDQSVGSRSSISQTMAFGAAMLSTVFMLSGI